MITTTLELVARAQLAADMHDGPFTPIQWMYWATQENIALSIFLARSGWTQNVKTATFTVDGTEAGVFTLDVNPLAILCVHQVASDGRVRRVKCNNAIDFVRQTNASTSTMGDPKDFQVTWDQDDDSYSVNFFPRPETGKTFMVSYIPHPLKLTLGTPEADVSTDEVSYPLGFEEWVVLSMAINAKDTEESETTGLDRRFAKVQSTIEQAVWDRVFAAATIRNVDVEERGWVTTILIPPNTEWWFA